MRRTPLIRPGPLTVGVCVWLGCELVAFALVVQRIGLGGALLIGLGTSVLGLAMMRRLGVNAIRGLRRALDGSQPSPGAMLDGSLAAFGSILLILPGFVSDLVGLALAAPSVRQWLAHRFGAVARPGQSQVRQRPGVVDLGPDDWRRVEEVETWHHGDNAPDRRRMRGG